MKVRRFKHIVLFLIFVSFVSCRKWVVDYRNKYLGEYDFTWTDSKWDWSNSVQVTTNHQTPGEIYYRPFHNFGKTVVIDILGAPTFEPKVDRNGKLKQNEGRVFGNGNISGNVITFTASISDGKAPPFTYTITGVHK